MTREMTEAQRVGLVRNALLVAGYEMGENGEHWPVINDCVHQIARDWEDHKLQKDADAEMKPHIYEYLRQLDHEAEIEGDAAIKKEMKIKFGELREMFDAYFADMNEAAIMPVNDEELPEYMKRVEAIISTLGGKNE